MELDGLKEKVRHLEAAAGRDAMKEEVVSA